MCHTMATCIVHLTPLLPSRLPPPFHGYSSHCQPYSPFNASQPFSKHQVTFPPSTHRCGHGQAPQRVPLHIKAVQRRRRPRDRRHEEVVHSTEGRGLKRQLQRQAGQHLPGAAEGVYTRAHTHATQGSSKKPGSQPVGCHCLGRSSSAVVETRVAGSGRWLHRQKVKAPSKL